MSFEQDSARHLAELRIKSVNLRWEKADMFHDCECEYCEYDGLKEDYSDEDVEKIEAEMKEIEQMFVRVKRHAEAAGIDVSEDAICAQEKILRGEKR